jgi:hypothetical protein
MRGDGLVVDPGTTHILKDVEVPEISEAEPNNGQQEPEEQKSGGTFPSLSIYDEEIVFVDPCYIFDLKKTYSCTTLHLGL